MSKSTFGLEVTALIAQHYPYALKGDAAQIGQCSAELAACLGGLLAFAYKFHGVNGATTAINLMVDRIVDNAIGIDQKAAEIVRTGISRAIGH